MFVPFQIGKTLGKMLRATREKMVTALTIFDFLNNFKLILISTEIHVVDTKFLVDIKGELKHN